jgi:hypothetical protein
LKELRRKGMTLALLWEEYCAETADLFSADHPVKPWRYSQFCENYRRLPVRAHQPHQRLAVHARGHRHRRTK